MNELDKKHRKDLEDKVEDVKKSLSLKVCWIQFIEHISSIRISCTSWPIDREMKMPYLFIF